MNALLTQREGKGEERKSEKKERKERGGEKSYMTALIYIKFLFRN